MEQGTMSGRQTVLMDGRNRISFPAGFRAVIGDWLFVSPDRFERHYLVVRSQADYNAELERLTASVREQFADEDPDIIEDEVEDVRRMFGARTLKVSPDKNGRITLNDELMQYAGLTTRVAVVGVGSYAELWDEETLDQHLAARAEARARRRAKLEESKRAKRESES